MWRKGKAGRNVVLSMRQALPQDDRKKQRKGQDRESPTGSRSAVMINDDTKEQSVISV